MAKKIIIQGEEYTLTDRKLSAQMKFEQATGVPVADLGKQPYLKNIIAYHACMLTPEITSEKLTEAYESDNSLMEKVANLLSGEEKND